MAEVNDETPDTNDATTIKLPSDTEIILNSIREMSKQIVALQSQIREMRQELNHVNSNMRRHPLQLNPNVNSNPFHTNEPPHRFSNNYNNDYYNNLLGGGGRHY